MFVGGKLQGAAAESVGLIADAQRAGTLCCLSKASQSAPQTRMAG